MVKLLTTQWCFFTPDDRGTVTHRYRSRFPNSSVAEGKPVGIKTETDLATTYLYGFQLSHMEPEGAAKLVRSMLLKQSTDIQFKSNQSLPQHVTMSQNYPNPFNPSTVISFSLNRSESISLEIINLLGQTVKSLVLDQLFEAGQHDLEWDGTNEQGEAVASGIYFYRLTTDDVDLTKKMLLLK